MERISNRGDAAVFYAGLPTDYSSDSVTVGNSTLKAKRYRNGFSSNLFWGSGVATFEWDRDDSVKWLCGHIKSIDK